MAILDFPAVENATEEGLVAVGGDLKTESLTLAYSRGIFPWPVSLDYPLTWFSPDPRGIITQESFTIPKSLKKFLNKNPYTLSFNQNFEAVINNCQEVKRKDQSETWITKELKKSYIKLHKAGLAYSVEVYEGKDLCGGLYGVIFGQYISGESMFYLKDNASKVALVALLEHLKKRNISWLDTQMTTPVVSSLGGHEIPRTTFLSMLEKSFSTNKFNDFFSS